MIFTVLGTIAILSMIVFDWADCRGLSALKIAVLAFAASLLLASSALLLAVRRPLYLSTEAAALCWVGAAASLFLLVVSLGVEVAFVGKSTRKRSLTTLGTYALVRHPGVLWFFFFHLFLALATSSIPFLIAVPCWTGANLLLAVVEDRVFFPRIFGDAYARYRSTVPFLVPSMGSLRNCVATFKLGKKAIEK
jgi:protein-S-isoprenylcysteine O-methyltransferase Ste14